MDPLRPDLHPWRRRLRAAVRVVSTLSQEVLAGLALLAFDAGLVAYAYGLVG